VAVGAAMTAYLPSGFEIEPGLRIAGRFELVKRIDRGSFGYIYVGLDIVTKDKVAVKVVRGFFE
jgi:hypothetical protein